MAFQNIDVQMPSTSSEAGTSSVKKRKLPEKEPSGHGKKRLVEEDDKLQMMTKVVLTDCARKHPDKAEDKQSAPLMRSLIDDHSGSGLTGRSSINLLLPSNFKEEIFEFTISCLNTNIRVNCAENEKFFGIFQDVAKFFRLNDGEFHLKFNGRPITAGDTPRTVGMPNRARIECIPLNRPHSSTNDAMNNP